MKLGMTRLVQSRLVANDGCLSTLCYCHLYTNTVININEILFYVSTITFIMGLGFFLNFIFK